MAHKKGMGSSRNGRDSCGQRRGVKVFAGESVQAGCILIRQCGTRVYPGENVGVGSDWTLYAKVTGLVAYERMGKDKRRVSVRPIPVTS